MDGDIDSICHTLNFSLKRDQFVGDPKRRERTNLMYLFSIFVESSLLRRNANFILKLPLTKIYMIIYFLWTMYGRVFRSYGVIPKNIKSFLGLLNQFIRY